MDNANLPVQFLLTVRYVFSTEHMLIFAKRNEMKLGRTQNGIPFILKWIPRGLKYTYIFFPANQHFQLFWEVLRGLRRLGGFVTAKSFHLYSRSCLLIGRCWRFTRDLSVVFP